MYDLEVETNKTPAMWSHNAFNRVELINLLLSYPSPTVRSQGEVRVPRDPSIADTIGKSRLLLLVNRSQSKKIELKFIRGPNVLNISMLLQAEVCFE
jgi:hypothetical protein